jgi:hypothetical protein
MQINISNKGAVGLGVVTVLLAGFVFAPDQTVTTINGTLSAIPGVEVSF